nr:uncharacterized protein LOC109153589 [Ipomoea trifida]GME10347.1 zinc finger BED domain-containing protein RICESLEEPER 2-like [Ipomoea batatas]
MVGKILVPISGNRSKVPRRDPGASTSCVSDDDFVSPPLAFLARLEQDHVWIAPDDALTGEEDAAFPRIKIRSQSSILVDALKDLSTQQKNEIDCGVFLMRHMETYLSQGVKKWDYRLVKGDASELHKLRMRFIKELSISEYNIHRSRNLSRAY